MIFNFFNSKNDMKQRNHNREQRQSDRNNGGSNAGLYSTTSYPRSQDLHHHRTAKLAAASSEARQSKVPQSNPGSSGKAKDKGMAEGAVFGQTMHSYNQTMLGINQTGAGQVTVNERYPAQISQTTNNGTFYRQKTGIRSVAN